MWTIKQSIHATLIYSGIFEYPLNESEILRYLIRPNKQLLTKRVKGLLKHFPQKNTFFSDSDIAKRVKLREQRKEISITKWNTAKKGSYWLSYIPTIDFIGVSGSLSMNNAKTEDDIDLFIVCYANTIWSTRLFVLLILTLLRKRRKFGDTKEKDLLCPNMFVASSHLRLPYNEQDLYSAHEVVQVEPLFVRGFTYHRFILENEWVSTMLPNAWKWSMKKAQLTTVYPVHLGIIIGRILFYLLNPVCKIPQRLLIGVHRTSEIISDSVLRFHPKDVRPYIHDKFIQKLTKAEIPLDSRFF